MRIRTVKPEFFRHELLQELEEQNPGQYVMLVYAGLWLAADKEGVFPWKPKSLHLDILPFLDFDFEKTMAILVHAKLLLCTSREQSMFGHIPKFSEHQIITGTEKINKPKYGGTKDLQDISDTMAMIGQEQGNDKDSTGTTQGNTDLRNGYRERINGKEYLPKEKTTDSHMDLFEQFWDYYRNHCKNAGTRQLAEDKWKKHIRDGVDPYKLINGSKEYLADKNFENYTHQQAGVYLGPMKATWKDYPKKKPTEPQLPSTDIQKPAVNPKWDKYEKEMKKSWEDMNSCEFAMASMSRRNDGIAAKEAVPQETK